MNGQTGRDRPFRRILAIWFARLSVDRWRHSNGIVQGEGADAEPTALITETAHGPRIDSVNDLGRSAGANAGMMLADARTICPHLKTAAFDPAGDLEFLDKLAVWAQRWGPWSALDPPDGILVDITGSAHLFGGERSVLADVAMAFAKRDLTVRAAIAPTAGAAWALSHFGKHSAPDTAIIEPLEDAMRKLADLPVAALRLDQDVLTVLHRLGLKHLADLEAVAIGEAADCGTEATGRDALQRRFRNRKSPAANPLVRLDQLQGKIPEPLLPVIPQIMPMVQRRLLEPIRHRDLLNQVLSDLTADMVRELEAKGVGGRRLELGLWRVDGEVLVRQLELAAATRDAQHIDRLFADKLDNIDAGFGIEIVRLRASWAEPLQVEQGDIDASAKHHGTSLAACIDRLTTRLGKGAVCRSAAYASHIPERAQRWQPPLNPDFNSEALSKIAQRPLKILDKAEYISVLYASPDGYPQKFRWRDEVREVARVEGPERIAPEWWRERSDVRLRDYYRIEDVLGRRYWIYRSGIVDDGRGGMPAWYLQGLYP
ncbi:MAG: DUF6504 family protein [Erythrobacter sp.]